MKEFIISIVESIVAALIFWLAFSYLPERHRSSKLRPKLELQIYQAYTTLFSLFDLVMQHQPHSPSWFQDAIKGAYLQQGDIELGLQNKCLNDSFLYDPNASKFLMPIGAEIYDILQRLDVVTDRLFQFINYLHLNEITCIEKIRSKLEPYRLDRYNRDAAIRVENIQLFPVDPSLSYLTTSLTELYHLFCNLQQIMLSNKYQDRDIVFAKVQCLFYGGHFSACKHLIAKAAAANAADKIWLTFYLLMCHHKNGDELLAHYKLEEVLESKPDLLYQRYFLRDMIGDPVVRSILHEVYTLDEIDGMVSALKREKAERDAFMDQAKALKEHYRQRGTRPVSAS